MRQAGTLSFLLADHLGSPTTMLDSAGATVKSERYFPYGKPRQGGLGQGQGSTTDKQFTGHQREGDLYYMNARFYDPLVGRFLQPDSIVPDYANPQSLNRYSYVLNNPLRYTDPTGNQAWARNSTAECTNLTQGLCTSLGSSAPSICSAEPLSRGGGGGAGFGGPIIAGGFTFAQNAPDPRVKAVIIGGSIVIAGGVICYQSACGDAVLEGITSGANRACTWLNFCSDGAEDSNPEAPAPDLPVLPSELPWEKSPQSPVPGWEWHGSPEEGSAEGAWVNPANGREYLHPDLGHEAPKGKHYTYGDEHGRKWDIYPNGRIDYLGR